MKRHMFFTRWMTVMLCGLAGLFFTGQPLTALADEQNPAGATGFTYSIIFPDNQTDKELGYYHLKMKPGQQQQLSIALSNPGSEKVTIDVKLNGAKTNQNGVIEYGESTIKNDPSLTFDFTDLVKGPKTVEVASGETKNLDLTIEMPETSYDGVIAGGIQLMRTGQNEATANSGGSQIINQYAYVIGMVLQENETVLTPDLALNNVKAGQNNYRNAIFVNFSNIIATYLDNMTIEVQITEKGKKTVLYERKQTAMRMAPNSFIEFPVSMNGERMEPGQYDAHILVTSGEKKWSWNQSFKITDQEANKFNERDVGLVQKKGLDWRLILLIVVVLLLCILLFFFIFRYCRMKKQQEEAALKKKRQQKKKNAVKNASRKTKDPKN